MFPRAKLAIFIDGCFWHGCVLHYVAPRSNQAYWGEKIARNMARVADTNARLTASGWQVMRFWAHEEPGDVVQAIRASLEAQREADPSLRAKRVSVGGARNGLAARR